MATEIKNAPAGADHGGGHRGRWLKAEGDPVKAGEPLLEITTDKLTNEVAAETDGVLLKIVAQEGADVPVKGACWATSAGPASRWGPHRAAAPAAPAVEAAAGVASAGRMQRGPGGGAGGGRGPGGGSTWAAPA